MDATHAALLTWAPVLALVALFLACVLLLALIAYDHVEVPTWDEVEQQLALCVRLHVLVARVWWAEHVSGTPTGRHVRTSG